MPKRKIVTSTPKKNSPPPPRIRPRELDTSAEIREEFNRLCDELDDSEVESERESDPDGEITIEVDDVVSDGDDGAARQRTARVLSWTDVSRFRPETFDFDRSESGIQDDFPVIDEEAKEIEYFESFFDEELVTFMCEQTNLYHEYSSPRSETPTSTSSATPTPSTSRQPSPTPGPSTAEPSSTPSPASGRAKMRKWINVTVKEMYTFLALLMLMVHVKKPVLKDYWITNDDITATPVFSKFMPRDRFMQILRYLHFVDNRILDDEQAPVRDRFRKIREFFSRLLDKYRSFFFPFQKLVIDESLVLFRGRVVFRQYIPSKRHRFGIKFFVICDCETGYVLDMIVYTASDIDIPTDKDLKFSGSVVKTLMDKYLNNHHILYTDNYYTSPALAQFLMENQTGCCGTVRVNRQNFPKFQKSGKKEVQLKKCDSMLAIAWEDKRTVHMLTTVNEGKMEDSGKKDYRTQEPIKKPDAVLDYNINMRLVDKSDMQIGSIECVRKSLKWYKKMFMHLVDVTILNAYNLWLVKTGEHQSLRLFQKNLIVQLLEKYGTVQDATPRRHTMEGRPDRLQASAYISRHFLDTIPPLASGKPGVRKCFVCSKSTRRPPKRKDIRTWCKECEVPLCMPCFREYHTKKYF